MIPHNLLTATRHGLMLANVHDRYIGASLIAFGEFSEGEVAFLQRYVGPEDAVIDVGANIGALTVPLARMAGRVFAFEPQRSAYQLLCANVALNCLLNVHTLQIAIGAPEGGSGSIVVPVVDVTQPGNFGALELGNATEGEEVPCMAIDVLGLPPAKLLKIDVEGMEGDVLRGARGYLAAHKPVLYVENDREAKAAALLALISELGYDAYWHRPPLFNPDNFKRQPKNPWPGVVSLNLICLPTGSPAPEGLERA